MEGSLFERGKALEDRFFSDRDKQLLEQLKQEISQSEGRDALSAASGISDKAVLDAMLESQITAETLTSISLVPLVAVAWADGVMEDKEKAAILKASAGAGISEGSGSYNLLESWLQSKPEGNLLDSWKDYIGALKSSIDETSFNQLRTTILGRAQEVASAAGGILGIGSTSAAETAVMKDLESAFGEYGQVSTVNIVKDRETGRSRGFGFVEMANSQDANAAIQGLNLKQVNGRAITVNEAHPKKDRRASNRY